MGYGKYLGSRADNCNFQSFSWRTVHSTGSMMRKSGIQGRSDGLVGDSTSNFGNDKHMVAFGKILLGCLDSGEVCILET